MDASRLTNFQLYALKENTSLNKTIRNIVSQEFIKRDILPAEIQELSKQQLSYFALDKDERLAGRYKILLILFPFFIIIHTLIAGRLLSVGKKSKSLLDLYFNRLNGLDVRPNIISEVFFLGFYFISL